MTQTANDASDAQSTSTTAIALAWLAVGLPLVWGVSQTLTKAMALFQ